MTTEPFYSSQGSEYERHKIVEDQENLESSPILGVSKPKRPPTVTPKRFNKFFTPRASLSSRGGRRSKAGRQLRDITKNGANRRGLTAFPQVLNQLQAGEDPVSERPLKRRKYSVEIVSSPPQSSPLKHVQTLGEVKVFEDVRASPAFSDGDELVDLLEDLKPFPKPVKRLPQKSQRNAILQREFGGYDALHRGKRLPDHCGDWRAETANFVSTPSERHAFTGTALPFCVASCNTNSLVAIGEEEGGVRFIDSAATSDFRKAHVEFRPHHNAIMDLAFSTDDYMLATASGDQTARIIDMHTQQTVCILSGHTSSVKQVRFQPNDDNILTTSSRDGSVQIWDMRCGGRGSIASLRTAFARNVDTGATEPAVQYSKHSIQLAPAHRSTTSSMSSSIVPVSDSGLSITSIQHLPHGREHLLVTASEVNSSIKLWDLRNAGRRGLAAPISSTCIPQSHARLRNYGINSMNWSTDGARLYATCRDGAVYAYSTTHLILGSAPELDGSKNKSRMTRTTKDGIGPLYAFRHPSLRMGSFYIKSAIRLASADQSEMLAVGSSDSCVVLFPTDERHLPLRERLDEDKEDESADAELPTPAFVPGQQVDRSEIHDMPVYQQGTALVRGHDKEATSVAWTHDGELVNVGDDFSARCWREEGAKARELRGCGERGGLRWRCGWADMEGSWDEDDC